VDGSKGSRVGRNSIASYPDRDVRSRFASLGASAARKHIPLVYLITLLMVTLSAVSCGGQSVYCQVNNVEWVGVKQNDNLDNLEIGGDPFGGADRIFPDRNHPIGSAGDDLHDRVLVRATLSNFSSLNKTYVVHFRIFDEDHYSSDGEFDPNGPNADDNVKAGEPLTLSGDSGAQLMRADFSAKDTMAFTKSNSAELGLQLRDLQPGNNWKVAAHCQDVIGQEGEEGGEGTVIVGPPPEDWSEAKRTPLLTVWRHLYVETDVMDVPVLNTGPGRSWFKAGTA